MTVASKSTAIPTMILSVDHGAISSSSSLAMSLLNVNFGNFVPAAAAFAHVSVFMALRKIDRA